MVRLGKGVYCVGCGQAIDAREAAQVFRTGFYRNTLPLGLCSACSQQESAGSGHTLAEPAMARETEQLVQATEMK